MFVFICSNLILFKHTLMLRNMSGSYCALDCLAPIKKMDMCIEIKASLSGALASLRRLVRTQWSHKCRYEFSNELKTPPRIRPICRCYLFFFRLLVLTSEGYKRNLHSFYLNINILRQYQIIFYLILKVQSMSLHIQVLYSLENIGHLPHSCQWYYIKFCISNFVNIVAKCPVKYCRALLVKNQRINCFPSCVTVHLFEEEKNTNKVEKYFLS